MNIIKIALKGIKRNSNMIFYSLILIILFFLFILTMQVRYSIYNKLETEYGAESQRQYVIYNKIYSTNKEEEVKDKERIERIKHVEKVIITKVGDLPDLEFFLVQVDSLKNANQVQDKLEDMEFYTERVEEGLDSIPEFYQKIDFYLSFILGVLTLSMLLFFILYTISLKQEENKELSLLYVLGYTKEKILMIRIIRMLVIVISSYLFAIFLSYFSNPIMNLLMKEIKIETYIEILLGYIPIFPCLEAIVIMSITNLITSFSKPKMKLI